MHALNRLDAHLQAARPGEDWTGISGSRGDDPLGMGEGAQALADIGELEQLAEQLSQATPARPWMTSTSTRWPVSSATKPPSMLARWPNSNAR